VLGVELQREWEPTNSRVGSGTGRIRYEVTPTSHRIEAVNQHSPEAGK